MSPLDPSLMNSGCSCAIRSQILSPLPVIWGGKNPIWTTTPARLYNKIKEDEDEFNQPVFLSFSRNSTGKWKDLGGGWTRTHRLRSTLLQSGNSTSRFPGRSPQGTCWRPPWTQPTPPGPKSSTPRRGTPFGDFLPFLKRQHFPPLIYSSCGTFQRQSARNR